MEKLSKLICKSAFLVLAGLIFLPTKSYTDVSIEGTFFVNAEVFYIGDLDFKNLEYNPEIFNVLINTNDPPDTVWLEFSIHCVSPKYGRLLWVKTDTFVLGNERSITNRDFANIEIVEYDFNFDLLEDAIWGTAKLPSGVYTFVLKIVNYNNPEDSEEASSLFSVANPTSVSLITPGGEPGDEEGIFTTYPQFQWESTADQFQLTVCEKLPEDASPDEVMNKLPHYQTIVDNQTFLEYPISGVRSLEPGHTYYWQVEALVSTSGGETEIQSEIWGFTVADEGEFTSLLLELTDLLWEEFGDILDILENYFPTGKIDMNGKTISIDELRGYLQDLRSGKYKITNVSVK